MTESKYLPTPFLHSYWVIPGKLLAGEYPADKYFEAITRQKLGGLLDAGIQLVIDLTYNGELPPYNAILHEIANWYGQEIEHQWFPITDFGIPSQDQMITILDAIDTALKDKRSVYVHCQAGLGRTGTVIGCYLARHGESGEQALETLAKLRMSTPNGRYRSPENQAQYNMVRNWPPGQ